MAGIHCTRPPDSPAHLPGLTQPDSSKTNPRRGCGPVAPPAWPLPPCQMILALPVVVPPAGTKSAARLEENVGALSVQLSHAKLAELEAAVPQDAVVGDRYAHMAGTYHGS